MSGSSRENPTTSGVRVGALAALLACVEAAEGPDRELDVDLAVEVGDWHFDHERGSWFEPGRGARACYPSLTASLDAAVGLCERVLPGWSWGISGATKPKCDGLLYQPSRTGWKLKIKGSAKTPPLALLAALLKALIAQAADTSERSVPARDEAKS